MSEILQTIKGGKFMDVSNKYVQMTLVIKSLRPSFFQTQPTSGSSSPTSTTTPRRSPSRCTRSAWRKTRRLASSSSPSPPTTRTKVSHGQVTFRPFCHCSVRLLEFVLCHPLLCSVLLPIYSSVLFS